MCCAQAGRSRRSPQSADSRGSPSPVSSPRTDAAQQREGKGSSSRGSRGGRDGNEADEGRSSSRRNSPRNGDSPRKDDSPRARTGSPRAGSQAPEPEPPVGASNETETASSPQTRAGTSLIFEGQVSQDTGAQVECIVSFPGRYEQVWRRIVGRNESRKRDTNAACVFFHDKHRFYGKHQMDEDTGKCYCHSIYGSEQPWGCRWFDEWTKHVKLAVERNQTLVVCCFNGQVGEGKVRWRELGMSFAERVQNRTDGKLLGLGISQAAEVAWLDRKGWSYQERDAFRILGEEQEEASMLDAIEAQLEYLNAYTAPRLFVVKQEQELITQLLDKASSEPDPTVTMRSISDPYLLAGLLVEWLRTRLDPTIPSEYCEECCSTVDPETIQLEEAFRSAVHDDVASAITPRRLASVVEGLAQFSEVGRLRLVRLVLILKKIDRRQSRVSSVELASVFAPILFSRQWLDQLESDRRNVASVCGREFVRLLIDRWEHDSGNNKGFDEISIETISLRVRQLYASQRRLDTKQRACDDATVQFELADKEQRKQHTALTGLLSRMQRAGDAITASRVKTIRGLCDEAVAAERKVDRLRAAHRRACTYKRLRKEDNLDIVREAQARCDVLQQEVMDAEAYVSQVYAEIDAEAHKAIGNCSASTHEAREIQLGAYADDLEAEIGQELDRAYAQNTSSQEDVQRMRQSIAAVRNVARSGGAPVGGALLEQAGQRLPILRRLQNADDMLDSLRRESPLDASAGPINSTAGIGQRGSETMPVSSGWLMLRSKHCVASSVATWKRRWVQVAPGLLSVYSRSPPEAGEALQQFELKPGTAVHAIADAPKVDEVQVGIGSYKGGQQWCFLTVFETGRPIYLQANSSDQRSRWIEAISAAVQTSDDEPEELYDNAVADIVDDVMSHAVDQAAISRERAAAAVLFDTLQNSPRVLLDRIDARRYTAVAQCVRSKVVRHTMTGAVYAHLLLGFAEPSLTNATGIGEAGFSCTTARVLELCLCGIHLVDCYSQAYLCRMSWANLLQTKVLVSIACTVISLVVVTTQACADSTSATYAADWLSLSHLLRPLLLLDTSQQLRMFCARLRYTLRSLSHIVTVILGLVVFWTLMGQSAFLDTQYHTDSNCTKDMKVLAASSFQSLHSGVSEMLHLTFGASNFPDVMLPALIDCGATSGSLAARGLSESEESPTETGWLSRALMQLVTVLFFVTFLFVTLLIMLSVTLAAVVTSQKKLKADESNSLADLRKGCFLLAFKLTDVTNRGIVRRRDFESVYQHYCELRGTEFVQNDVLSMFQRLTAASSEDTIGVEEFFALCETINAKNSQQMVPSWITHGFRWTWRLPLDAPTIEVTVLRKRSKRDPASDPTGLREMKTAAVRPAMTFELSWEPPHDLDLYCTSKFVPPPADDDGAMPNTSRSARGVVSYRTKNSPCGGILSKDSKFNEEIMTWDKPYAGTYLFEIRNDRGRSLERDQKRQGAATGADYRCKLTFAYGGGIGVVDENGKTHQLRPDSEHVIEFHGNTDDFDDRIPRYEITWDGYERIEHRVHATTPRVQRAVKGLAEIDPSRVSALPVSEPGLMASDEVDVCVVLGEAQSTQAAVFDGIVMAKRGTGADTRVDVCAWASAEGNEDTSSAAGLVAWQAQVFLTWRYSVAHDVVHTVSVVATMMIAGSTQAGQCSSDDLTESCMSTAGYVGYAVLIACSVALMVDTLAKIFILGWARCWHTQLFRLDGCVALLVAIALLGLLVTGGANNNGFKRIFRLMLHTRLWSGVRIFRQADQDFGFENIDALLQLVWRMFFALAPVVLCLGAIVYVYAAIGVYSFSLIHPSDQALLEGTEYSSKTLYWEVVNFSDLRSSYLTLVHLLVHSNWHITHEACVQAIRSHYMRRDGACGSRCGVNIWMTTLYHSSYQFLVATVLTYTAVSCILENYTEPHNTLGSGNAGSHETRRRFLPTALGSNASTTSASKTVRNRNVLTPTVLQTLQARSRHGQPGNPCIAIKNFCVRLYAWFRHVTLLYCYGQCANCNRSHAADSLPPHLECSRVFMPTFIADWRQALDLKRESQPRDRTWQGFQPVMLCQECEAQQRVKYLELSRTRRQSKSRGHDHEEPARWMTDGPRSKADRRADRKAARAAFDQRKRESRRSLLNDLEIAPDGPHAQTDHAEGCFFKTEPAESGATHVYSTVYPLTSNPMASLSVRVESASDASTCVPQSFSGSSVRDVVDRSYGDGSKVVNPHVGIFGISVQQLACTEVDFGESDVDSVKLTVPAILTEILNRLVDLGAQDSNAISVVLGSKGALEPAMLKMAMGTAAQLARRYDNDEPNLVESSDDPAVWAALLRHWHEEMPAGGRLLSWPRGGARARAMELGTRTAAHLVANGDLHQVRKDIEGLLQQLEPCQRGSILKLVDFFARLDRKQTGLRANGVARNELERTLARWWLDPAYTRSDADEGIEQQDAGAGFISLLLNLDPCDDSAPEIRHALGELQEQRKQHGLEASLALLDGRKPEEDASGTEKAATKKSTTLTGMAYSCTTRCPVTAGIELNSAKVGMLRVGEVVAVMEEQWLDVEGALSGPSYNRTTGEVEESLFKSDDAESGKVHRVRFQRGSQECWASVHTVRGVPLLQPLAKGKATTFGKERYAYGMSQGRPDSLGRFSSQASRRGQRNGAGSLDTTITPERIMLGLEWARTKQGKEEQIGFLWGKKKEDEA